MNETDQMCRQKHTIETWHTHIKKKRNNDRHAIFPLLKRRNITIPQFKYDRQSCSSDTVVII